MSGSVTAERPVAARVAWRSAARLFRLARGPLRGSTPPEVIEGRYDVETCEDISAWRRFGAMQDRFSYKLRILELDLWEKATCDMNLMTPTLGEVFAAVRVAVSP